MVRKLKSKTGGSGNILQQAQEMQAKMIQVQEQLKSRLVEASVGGGAVIVKVNGQKEVLSVTLSEEIVKEAVEDKGMLEDLILSAVTEAMRQAEELAEKEMGAITGGINIPGLI